MWLLVAAPTVSRVLPSAWLEPDPGAWCTDHGFSDQHPSAPSSPHDSGLRIDHCGYCTLLGHSPLQLGGAPAPLVWARLPALAPVAATDTQQHALPLLSAHPRGPPSFLSG